jgi:hypothetical protein
MSEHDASKFEFNPAHEVVDATELRDMVLDLIPAREGASIVSTKLRFGPTVIVVEREAFDGERPTLYVDVTENYSKGKDSLTRSCTIDEETGQAIDYAQSVPIPGIRTLGDLASVHVDKPRDEVFVPLAIDVEATVTEEKIKDIEFEIRTLTQNN